MNNKIIKCPKCNSTNVILLDGTVNNKGEGHQTFRCRNIECQQFWRENTFDWDIFKSDDFKAKVDSKGRIVIDSCVRKQKGIKEGDTVRVTGLEKIVGG